MICSENRPRLLVESGRMLKQFLIKECQKNYVFKHKSCYGFAESLWNLLLGPTLLQVLLSPQL